MWWPWAPARSNLSMQLTAVLERLMNEQGGKIALGRVDVDSSPQIAQAFGATAVPTTIALINGQPVPMFEGEIPEEQIREFLTELLKVAASNGVTGNLGGAQDPAAEARSRRCRPCTRPPGRDRRR